MGRSAEEHLRQVADALPAKRCSAIWGLSRAAHAGDVRALGALRMSLNDSDATVREAAEQALAGIQQAAVASQVSSGSQSSG
ncbi:MAG: hypothetical protein QOJ38_966 [Solirubrobacterales bacterium]|jgi:hypothetical protein|nr:hypothetical protein [Solirubrobacterales bacterium]